ncbi:MAG: head GIN domain-containing protein [Ferruginibacter sp.]
MKQFLFLFAGVCLLLSSCNFETGSGNIVNEKRLVGSFTGISVGGSFEVEVKSGTSQSVEVEADDNVIKYIETTVSGDVLKIRLSGSHSLSNVHLKVLITTTGLESIKASASADVKVLDVMKEDSKISFEATSSAEIDAEVDAPEIVATGTSSASLHISGRTKNYIAKVNSSAEIKSFELLSENTEVNASSSGNAEVHASVYLKAHANSSGSIDYRGGASVEKSESSSGSVEKKD